MKNDNAELRRAHPSDAKSMWKVRTLAIRGIKASYDKDSMLAWSPEEMPQGFAKDVEKNPWFVIAIQGDIVATGALDLDKGTVEGMFTVPQYQGKHYGEQILLANLQEAKNRGFSQLTLESTLNAEKFYQKHGFQFIEKSKYNSPSGLVLDCVKMQIDL